MSDFFEKCWFIFGFRIKNIFIGIIIKHSDGTAGAVDFDWEKIYNSKRLIGFFHTHPSGMMHYSDIDNRTMKAWVSCLWRDLICGIWNEERTKRDCNLFTKEKEVKYMKVYWDKLFFIGERLKY